LPAASSVTIVLCSVVVTMLTLSLSGPCGYYVGDKTATHSEALGQVESTMMSTAATLGAAGGRALLDS
jgi:hypothetical protein